MSSQLERMMRRVEDGVERVLDREQSARVVMNQVIAEGAPAFMQYRMKGYAPSIDLLERIAIKLLAIVVATEEANR
jgi:hypothetical protein